MLGSVTNMAEICARLCPSDHLCEGACLLDSVSEAVSIRALEQFLVEYAFNHGAAQTATAPPNGRKVAVVGAGPGGLACAEQLARKGYSVTVYDSEMVPGGLLVNGVAAFRVDRSVVQRRLDLLRKLGVTFSLGVTLSEKLSLKQLQASFDAVFLCFDWRKSRALQVPGSNSKGVIPAMAFLLQKKTALPLDLPQIDVKGKRVLVIGGGDTAIDCVRSAIRYGAAEATCVYRREEMEMPCSGQERASAIEEGARFIFRAAPIEVLSDPNGFVTHLRAIRTQAGPLDGLGRQSFTLRPKTEFLIEADWIIPALGFDAIACPNDGALSSLQTNECGCIAVDERQMTNLPGVFAGGDIVHGPLPLLKAVRDARSAATHIHNFLSAKLSPHE